MVQVGYTLMCEQAGPKRLVDHAQEGLAPRLRER